MRNYVYVDMDGVVADFNGLASELLNREIAWEGRAISPDEWKILSAYPNFYYNLKLTPIAEELMDLVKSTSSKFDIAFLSAVTSSMDIEQTMKDKHRWIQKYFPGIPLYFGPKSTDKKYWCVPNDILIDDKHSNVIEWESVGGISIHHVDDTTIDKFYRIAIMQ